MITLIAAIARNLAIGNQNKLLYWLPDDMKRFRQLTTGHTIIMGRLTFESFPKGPLPNRRNVILSRQEGLTIPGAEVFPTLEAALLSCQPQEDIYIIGGASVYAQALPHADRLCLTEVDDTPQEADAYFPPFDKEGWNATLVQEHPTDEKHSHTFRFVDYTRKQ